MYRRPLQTTQRKAQKSKSQPIRQTNSGNKNLKLTNRGENIKTLPTSKQKKDPLLKVSYSPKNKKISQKSQPKQLKVNKKVSRQSFQSKQKGRKKIISYKSQQIQTNDQQQDLKKSVVQIDFPNLEDPIDDDINLLSISNYPVQNNNDFLRETHITNDLSIKKLVKQKSKKHEELKKSTGKLRKTNTMKSKDSQSKTSRSKTASEKKDLQKSIRKATLQKSHKKLQKSNNGLKVSVRPLQKSTKGALSKTKLGKKQKQKSSSTQTKKGTSAKKQIKPAIKSGKSPIPTNLPKSIPKPTKSKKKQLTKKKPSTIHPGKYQQESSSDTTKTPTLQELQRLRQQNDKYKMFLASSAFKVDQLKKQIEQHKQIRQNQRSLYNFQLNNLKKQLDANKTYLGHLYSYDEPGMNPNGFLPDQIIIETDNQSSSVRDSMNMISKMSKQLNPDDLLSQNSSNKVRKSTQSMAMLGKSNQSSNNENEDQSKLAKSELTNVIKQIKEDLIRQQANLKFLSDIKKIPSLEVRLSLQASDKSNQAKSINQTQKINFLKTPANISNLSNDQGQNALLLLNSIRR